MNQSSSADRPSNARFPFSRPLHRLVLGVLTLAFALLLAGPAFGGVVFEVTQKDHSSGSEQVQQMMAEGKMFKMQVDNGNGGVPDEMIYRGDLREMWVVNHEHKSVMVLDEAGIQQVAGQLNDAMAQMQEALKNVPADQRAMVENMLKKRMPAGAALETPSVEVRKTGKTGSHEGMKWIEYEVWVGEKKSSLIRATDWSNVEGGEEVREAFQGMVDFMKDMMDAFASQSGFPGIAQMGHSAFAQMSEIGGFPVVTQSFSDGLLDNETILNSSERRSLSPEDFEPPKGYKRRSMMDGR